MTRSRSRADVVFFEEPIFGEFAAPELSVSMQPGGICVVTPLLPHGWSDSEIVATQRNLLNDYLKNLQVQEIVAWYYTPMALRFSDHLKFAVTVYDCMDELSAFQGADPELLNQEKRLFERADIVFTGGQSLYEAKRTQHANAHLFPSSIDYAHFAQGRTALPDPPDQQPIPHPRIGFYGVIDERLHIELIRDVAAMRPDWHIVLIGPVVKIPEEDLPRSENIHYLGQKNYSELPMYLAHWDVAMLPFANNASTRFISPTKTPEYLAAGKPVVSTPIRDVVTPYGDMGLVKIAGTAHEFIAAIEYSLADADAERLSRVDRFLAGTSWDKTFEAMWNQISGRLGVRERSGIDV